MLSLIVTLWTRWFVVNFIRSFSELECWESTEGMGHRHLANINHSISTWESVCSSTCSDLSRDHMLLRVPPLALESQSLQQHRKQTWPWILDEVSRVLGYLKLPAWDEDTKTQGSKETRLGLKFLKATGSYPVKVTWRMKILERGDRAERKFKVTSVQALYRLPSTQGFFTVDTVSLHFDQWIRPVQWRSPLSIPSHQRKWCAGFFEQFSAGAALPISTFGKKLHDLHFPFQNILACSL